MNRIICISRPLLLSLILSTPSYASLATTEHAILYDNLPQNGSTTMPDLGKKDRKMLLRSMETDQELGQFSASLPQTHAPLPQTSKIDNKILEIENILQNSLSYQDHIVATPTLVEFNKDAPKSFGSKAFYDPKRPQNGKAIEIESMTTLYKRVMEVSKNYPPVFRFLDLAGRDLLLERFNALTEAWKALVTAYETAPMLMDFQNPYLDFRKQLHSVSADLTKALTAIGIHNNEHHKIMAILPLIQENKLALNKLSLDTPSELKTGLVTLESDFHKLLNKVSSLAKSHKIKAIKEVTTNCQEKKPAAAEKNDTMRSFDALYKNTELLKDRIVNFTKPILEERSSVTPVVIMNQEPTATLLPKSKNKTRGVADPEKASQVRANLTPLKSNEEQSTKEKCKLIPIDEAAFIKWKNSQDAHSGKECSKDIDAELDRIIKGEAETNGRSIMKAPKKDGKKSKLREQRFKYGDLTLRVYTAKYNGNIHVLAWGDKSSQQQDMLLAIDRENKLFRRAF